MSSRAKVVVLNMPRMQREILQRTLAAEPDIEVIDGVETAADLVRATRRSRAEFVITGAGGVEGDAIVRVLEDCPGVKVVAVSESGRQGLLYELRPHRVPLGDLSSGALVEAIRRARDQSSRARLSRRARRPGSNGRRR